MDNERQCCEQIQVLSVAEDIHTCKKHVKLTNKWIVGINQSNGLTQFHSLFKKAKQNITVVGQL